MNRLLMLVFAMLSTLTASADQFIGQAAVVDVVPLTRTVTDEVARVCETPRPLASDGLSAMLKWDLCPPAVLTREVPDGYRVFYKWDNRVYDRVMARDPGESVAVRVRVN